MRIKVKNDQRILVLCAWKQSVNCEDAHITDPEEVRALTKCEAISHGCCAACLKIIEEQDNN